jgi:hypothetical protein
MSFKRFNKLRKLGIAGKLMDGPSQVVSQMSQNLHMQQRGSENQFLAGTGQKENQTVGGNQAQALTGVAQGRGKVKGQVGDVNKTLIADSDARYQQAVAEAQHAQMVENERARVETAENAAKAGKKGAMMGSIGAIAGMAAGVLLAPATGGMSMMIWAIFIIGAVQWQSLI